MSETSVVYMLENTSGRHHKFYEIIATENKSGQWDVTTRYGKIGTTGRPGYPVTYMTAVGAKAFAKEVRDKKIARGYSLVTTPTTAQSSVSNEFARFNFDLD